MPVVAGGVLSRLYVSGVFEHFFAAASPAFAHCCKLLSYWVFVPGVNLVFTCLMDRVAKSEKRAIHADGAWSWKGMALGFGIPCHQVSHQRKQIVVERSGPQPRSSQGLSKLCGTQPSDLAWRELKRCLPQRNLERKGGSRSEMNHWIAGAAT